MNLSKLAIAHFNAESFRYYINTSIDNEDHIKAIFEEMKANKEDCVLLRERPRICYTISEQLQTLNNTLIDIENKCNLTNVITKKARKLHKSVSQWYTTNKDKIQFKDDGSLYKKWSIELRELLKDDQLIISFEWEYSLRISIRSSYKTTDNNWHYIEENIYIVDNKGELYDTYNSKLITPNKYRKSLAKLKALEEKQQDINNQISSLKVELGL